MSHQPGSEYQDSKSHATARPAPRAAPGVKIVTWLAVGLLLLICLAVLGVVRALY